MKLPDFLDDTGLNTLRQKMGAEGLGEFELFDPQKQLTYSEREALEEGHFSINAAELRALKDKTLAYKNSRIWLGHEQKYHLAYCQTVQQLRHRQVSVVTGTEANAEDDLCLECLALLKYQGVDSRRVRRNEFTEHVQEEFDLADFKKTFPFYPV